MRLTALAIATAVLAWSPAATADDHAAPEPSVAPGANDRFLEQDLDVDEWVERFEGEAREIAVHRDAIVKAVGLKPGGAVADVGAGTGLFVEPFARAVGTAGKVYAVDISPAFVDSLSKRAAEAGLTPPVEAVLGTDRSPKLPVASVDTVFLCDTYHHFEYPQAMLAELHAALRPGGQMVVVEFHRIPGKTRDWVMEHVRDGEEVFRKEILAAGFTGGERVPVAGLEENYVLRFQRP